VRYLQQSKGILSSSFDGKTMVMIPSAANYDEFLMLAVKNKISFVILIQ
jgi:hypothetical protein